MDQAIRNKLRGVVTQCRKLLEDATAQALQGRFGVYAGARKKGEVQIEDETRMSHLTDEDRACRQDLLDHLAHIQAIGYKPSEALEQLVREIAFTHLNRLCAYKMMESRGLIREAVSRGLKSQGFFFYLADHPEAEKLHNSGQQDIAYRNFLDWLGGTLSQEIGVLFNTNDPANRIYPPQRVLDEVLALINDRELKDIWSQDETIGWVYQYFTPKELRDKARKESQAPRNSYELAFRNQFFTPRYVVEFLTDNTLGRIWYEMRKGHTALKDRCKYLVRRPKEIFLKDGELPPAESKEAREDLSQEELLKQPVYITHRPKKDPRELKVLDPACGSGHFLLYCFDLLQTIYEEAYDDPDLSAALRSDYPAMDDLRRAVPGLILKHNLHGIDIDLRATQIAALAVWLRCQRAYQEIGLKNGERPIITRSNLVCAEPMPGETDLLKEFTATLQPKVLGQLVETVFEKMKLAGEAGSLLKIEEEIREAASKAKFEFIQWKKHQDKAKWSLFPELVERDQPSIFDFTDMTDEVFLDRAEDEIVASLRQYSEKASNGSGFRRRLFAEDAARGFSFVDVLRKEYDVVLMNPPFGASATQSHDYIEDSYPSARFDLGAAFMAAMCLRAAREGRIGVIANRTIWFLHRCGDFRKQLLSDATLHLGVDTGLGVLDAFVETGLLVFSPCHIEHSYSLWLKLYDNNNQEALLSECSRDILGNTGRVFLRRNEDFEALDEYSFTYWLPKQLQDILANSRTLADSGNEAKQGLATKDNERFLRLRWEVPTETLGVKWFTYSKGGPFAPLIGDYHLIIDWSAEAHECYAERDGQFCCLITGRSNNYAFRPGITYSSRTSRFSARIFPAGCLFDCRGPLVFLKSVRSKLDCPDTVLSLTLVLNTSIAQYIFDVTAGASNEGKGRDYSQGMLLRFPYDSSTCSLTQEVIERGKNICQQLHELYSGDPTNALFLKPLLGPSFAKALAERNDKSDQIQQQLDECLDKAEREFAAHLKLNEKSIEDIRKAVAASHKIARHEILVNPNKVEYVGSIIDSLLGYIFGRADVRFLIEQNKPLQKISLLDELPTRFPGFLDVSKVDQKYPILIRSDGILADDAGNEDDIIRQVQGVLEVIWKDRAEAIEQEACEILGVRELRDYFRKPGNGGFWMDHVKCYSKSRRKAPIYWYLRSAKGNYGLWLYYHRLDKDILFKALLNYVEPKIRMEEDHLKTQRIRKEAAGSSGHEAKQIEKDMDRQEQFVSELHDFADKLRRAADLHLEPDLNDGVVLNIASLWELAPWKEAKEYWEDLVEGKYEWSSIALQLWPERVKELCKKDRSIAIAHGLEHLCEVEPAKIKRSIIPKEADTEEVLEDET